MLSTDEAILYWLAAARVENVGPVRFKRWLETFGNMKEIFVASTRQLEAAGLSIKEMTALREVDWLGVEKDQCWSEGADCHLLHWGHPAYPCLLLETNDPPLILFVKGDVNVLQIPQLAIVGSRNPTPMGRELAEHFAAVLSRTGLGITSGLALGIDAAGHKGALSVNGKTIAVIGSGIDNIYPASHKSLAKQIATQGAIVSEFSPTMRPHAKNFPRRNRVISGMSVGVLVVEAALRSGSLITARCAIEQGRDVFAIPGSVHSPLAKGCHALIRQGAKLVEQASDIIEEIASLSSIAIEYQSSLSASKVIDLSEKEQEFLRCLGYHATPLDTLIERSGLTAGQVSSMLLVLELRGYVAFVTGGYIRSSR